MAGINNIPFAKVGEFIGGAREGQRRRRECVRVAVELEDGAPRELALALKGALMPETASGLVHVGAIRAGVAVRVNPDADVAVIVAAGPSGPGASVARAFRRAGVPCVIVVESSLDAPGGEGLEGTALVSAASTDALLAKLASWMADACGRDIALAANFPFCRRAVAERCVRERSAQNAVVGLGPLGSGADLPIMAANQALMALDISGAYGRGADAERLGEVAVVLALALSSRSLARRLCAVLPGLGLLIKAGIAYGGTYCLGEALVLRLELAERLGHGAASVENPSRSSSLPLTNAKA